MFVKTLEIHVFLIEVYIFCIIDTCFFLFIYISILGYHTNIFSQNFARISASGLLIASRYPVLETKVGFFAPVAIYQQLFGNAYLFVKLDIGAMEDASGTTKAMVGYLATTHLPAYESETTATSRESRPLSKLHSEFNKFQKDTLNQNEELAFAVVAGDFNLCNICKCK